MEPPILQTTVEVSNPPQPDPGQIKVRLAESASRSLVKAVVWRLLATSATILVSYLYLGNLNDATEIGIIDCFGKLILHYGYERGFTRIEWGYIEQSITTN